MWVYVGVFGLVQWAIFVSLLVATIAAFAFSRNRNSKEAFSGQIVSGIAMAFMFTLQLGTHANLDGPASKMVQLTASMLTLVMFAYYTTGMEFNAVVIIRKPQALKFVWY